MAKLKKMNVNVMMTVELRKRILTQAEIEHRDLSGMIRHAVLVYLEANERRKKGR